MNKKSRKTKTFSLRLIALLLCCVCLVGAMPLVSATGEEGSTVEAGTSPTPGVQEDEQGQQEDQDDQEGQNDPEGQDDQEGQNDPEGQDDQEDPQQGTELTAEELYNKLMACETREEMQALMDEYGDLIDEMVFSDEQEKALTEKMEELGLYEAEEAYRSEIPVYWDTTDGTKGLGGTGVASVTLGSTGVVKGDSNRKATSSGGNTLSKYFPGASKQNPKSANLVITAATGYYVTRVVVACSYSANSTPYNDCKTWKNGAAYDERFTLSKSTASEGQYTLTGTLKSSDFQHQGEQKNAYFILIQVAPIPTPLYVEYDYGTASAWKKSSGSAFDNANTWTTADAKNSYGSGKIHTSGILTANTQFAYQYTETSQTAGWKHYANTISKAAIAEASAAGYRFAGWKATYYETCQVSGNGPYTMTFSKQWGGTTPYEQGAEVAIPMNVCLVAQWEKVPTKTLTVKKTVSGNMADMTKAFNFTVTVGQGTPQTFQLKADETNTITVPEGAVVTVSEEPDGYTNTIGNGTTSDLEYTVGEDKKSISFTMPNKDVRVVVNNEKTATIDTGIGLDALPYVLILGLVACGGVLTLRKRRSQNAQ